MAHPDPAEWFEYLARNREELCRSLQGKVKPPPERRDWIAECVDGAIEATVAAIGPHPERLGTDFPNKMRLKRYALVTAYHLYLAKKEQADRLPRADVNPEEVQVAAPDAEFDVESEAEGEPPPFERLAAEVGYLNARVLLLALEGQTSGQIAATLQAEGGVAEPCDVFMRLLGLRRAYPDIGELLRDERVDFAEDCARRWVREHADLEEDDVDLIAARFAGRSYRDIAAGREGTDDRETLRRPVQNVRSRVRHLRERHPWLRDLDFDEGGPE